MTWPEAFYYTAQMVVGLAAIPVILITFTMCWITLNTDEVPPEEEEDE